MASEILPPKQECLGIIQESTPCKGCVLNGDECHFHKSQFQCIEIRDIPVNIEFVQEVNDMPAVDEEEQGTTTESIEKKERCEVCIGLGKSCVYHKYQTVHSKNKSFFGIDQKGEPCRMCIRRGDFCLLHEMQRVRETTVQNSTSQESQQVFGITLKGKPCKMCIYEGDFCSLHEKQKKAISQLQTQQANPPPKSSSVQNSKVSREPKGFGMSLSGKICKRCISKGDFCRPCLRHKVQQNKISSSGRKDLGSKDMSQRYYREHVASLPRRSAECSCRRVFYLIFLVMAVYEVFFIGHRTRENVKYGVKVVSDHGQRINNIVAQKRALFVTLRTRTSLQLGALLGQRKDQELALSASSPLYEVFDSFVEGNDTNSEANLTHGEMLPTDVDYDSIMSRLSVGLWSHRN